MFQLFYKYFVRVTSGAIFVYMDLLYFSYSNSHILRPIWIICKILDLSRPSTTFSFWSVRTAEKRHFSSSHSTFVFSNPTYGVVGPKLIRLIRLRWKFNNFLVFAICGREKKRRTTGKNRKKENTFSARMASSLLHCSKVKYPVHVYELNLLGLQFSIRNFPLYSPMRIVSVKAGLTWVIWL